MINDFRGKYYFLSNFYPCALMVDNRMYSCSEGAYMSMKTIDPKVRDKFSYLAGKDARKLGRSVTIRPNWDDLRLGMMEMVLNAKFAQNPTLMKRLIDTGNEELVEGNTWGDHFWGVDEFGANNLGKLLMKIRDAHQKKRMQ